MRKKLIELRGNKSQEEVSKEIGITQQFLSAIEKGERNPSIKIMKKFEIYYQKSMLDLFEDIFLSTITTNRCNVQDSA